MGSDEELLLGGMRFGQVGRCFHAFCTFGLHTEPGVFFKLETVVSLVEICAEKRRGVWQIKFTSDKL